MFSALFCGKYKTMCSSLTSGFVWGGATILLKCHGLCPTSTILHCPFKWHLACPVYMDSCSLFHPFEQGNMLKRMGKYFDPYSLYSLPLFSIPYMYICTKCCRRTSKFFFWHSEPGRQATYNLI